MSGVTFVKLCSFGKLNTFLYDFFHVPSFRTYDSSCDLKITFIMNLNFVSAGELILLGVIGSGLLHQWLLLASRTKFVH